MSVGIAAGDLVRWAGLRAIGPRGLNNFLVGRVKSVAGTRADIVFERHIGGGLSEVLRADAVPLDELELWQQGHQTAGDRVLCSVGMHRDVRDFVVSDGQMGGLHYDVREVRRCVYCGGEA